MSQSRVILNLSLMTGSLAQKLGRAAALNFSAIEVGNNDMTSSEQSLPTSTKVLADSPLSVAAFHELKDFLGHPSHMMEYKMNLAKANLQLMSQVNADLLLVTPTLSRYKETDPQRQAKELRALAVLATVRGVRIGFKPLRQSPAIGSYEQSLDLLKRVNNSNLCLVLDNLALRQSDATALQDFVATIPIESIGLVQLSAAQSNKHPLRLLPTAHRNAPLVKALIEVLEQRGYQGCYSLNADAQAYHTQSVGVIDAEVTQSLNYIQGLIRQTSSL